MSVFLDFLEEISALFEANADSSPSPDEAQSVPGLVTICFVNRYLEPMDGIKYKIKFDGKTVSGTTTATEFNALIRPVTLGPVKVYVWSRRISDYKLIDTIIPLMNKPKLVYEHMRSFKHSSKTHPHPKNEGKPPESEPRLPKPAPGDSPADNQGAHPEHEKNKNDEPVHKGNRPVPDKITVAQLRKIFPVVNKNGQPTDAHLQAVADELNMDLEKFKLDTPLRRAHFFGQVRQEAGPLLSGAPESFNFKASTLLGKFSYYKQHRAEAKVDGRAENNKIPLTLAQQQVVANKVYGGMHGYAALGNQLDSPADGWNYRGRGMKQTTGRFNYTEFCKTHKELWGEDVDFVAYPDKVSDMPYAVRSAVVFWVYKNCWQAADSGMNDGAIDAVTRIVNAGELAAYKKHPTTDSPVLNRRKFAKLAYAAFS